MIILQPNLVPYLLQEDLLYLHLSSPRFNLQQPGFTSLAEAGEQGSGGGRGRILTAGLFLLTCPSGDRKTLK